MNWLSISLFIIWIYLLTVFKRGKLEFPLYLLGSVGFFIFALIWIEPLVVEPLQKSVAAATGVLGNFTGMYESYFQKSIIFVYGASNNLSLYVDIECSGIIEMFAFIALLLFFPVYSYYEKIAIGVLGMICVFMANVFRIFIICIIIYIFGENSYFFAHTVIGRLFFYACTITLYFYVFTKSQIIRQKVGAFRYGDGERDI